MQKLILLLLTVLGLMLLTACQTANDLEKTDLAVEAMEAEESNASRALEEENFLAMMIPHHQEAIDTATVILEKSANNDLRVMAEDIVSTQTDEISQMEAWGKAWFGSDFSATVNYHAMMPDLSKLEGDELDQAFISGMIMHHEMAIKMAKTIKELTNRSELLKMADAIIGAQTSEITMMRGWLK